MGRQHPLGGGCRLTGQMREAILRYVAESNTKGGWNNALYWAAHRLFEAGDTLEEATTALLDAAAPWDEREKADAMKTVESALNSHLAQQEGARK
jgi:hypothetical protein